MAATKRSTKSASGRKTTSRARKSTAAASRNAKSFDFKNINKADLKRVMRKATNNPVALYLAGGVGAFFLARFAFRYYRNHPEIQEFIRENIDTVESTLREYRNEGMDDTAEEARH